MATPTQVTTVLTTVQWNALIDKVNTATQKCGGGSLKHVTDPYLWSLTDIQAVQKALKAGCSTAKFTGPSGPPYIWMQTIIDEINKAISVACCSGGGGNSGSSGSSGPTEAGQYAYFLGCSNLGNPTAPCAYWGEFPFWGTAAAIATELAYMKAYDSPPGWESSWIMVSTVAEAMSLYGQPCECT
jgi:hypothetical protein